MSRLFVIVAVVMALLAIASADEVVNQNKVWPATAKVGKIDVGIGNIIGKAFGGLRAARTAAAAFGGNTVTVSLNKEALSAQLANYAKKFDATPSQN